MERVLVGQIDIADGIVHLIQIVFVLRVLRHGLQLADHLLAVGL